MFRNLFCIPYMYSKCIVQYDTKHLEISIFSNNIANTEEHSEVCRFITLDKVVSAFQSFGDYKAPGPDEVPPIVLKNLDNAHLAAITRLYKESVKTGEIPISWQRMKVVFIPKAGKDDYSMAKSYRPITLSNFLLKGLERIIQWYIQDNIMKEPLFQQHAYTKGRSCDSALSEIVDEIEGSIYNEEYLLAVSLDCSGAFDCIKFQAAKEAMLRKNIPNSIIRWYDNLLKGRVVTANMQGCDASILPARGSPQGGVLSPLIWNLIMDTFLSKFTKGPVKVIGYADDILLYVKGSTPETLIQLLQPRLDEAVDWGKKNGLSFNPVKTNVVFFTKKRRTTVSGLARLRMGGRALEYTNSMKYLGVELQQSLTWTNHVTARVNKCKYLLTKCRTIINRCWGLTPSRMEWVYKAIIRPKMTYGALVWANHLTKGLQDRIQQVQRLAMLAMTHPLRSTPTLGLEVMLGWIPLHLHSKEVGMCTHLRIKDKYNLRWDGIGSKNHAKGHRKLWSKEEEQVLNPLYPREGKIHTRIWMDEKQTDQGTSEDLPQIEVYSDASKKNKDVGIGWVVCEGDYIIAENIFPLKEYYTHDAELLAIMEAMEWLRYNLSRKHLINLYCDSTSAITVLKGQVATSTTSIDALNSLKSLAAEHNICIRWVKGHNNNTGNEYADFLARKGMNMAKEISYPEPYIPLGYKAMKRLVHARYISKWQIMWENEKSCNITKLFYPVVRENKEIAKMTIKELQNLSQIVTGHGLYKHHLRHWNEIDSIDCQLCGEDREDPWHLWNLCPKLEGLRKTASQNIREDRQGSLEKGLLKFFGDIEILELKATNELMITPT